MTDDDGDFVFRDLESGKWTFVILHEGNFPSKRLELELTEDVKNIKVELFRPAGNENQATGKSFFISLIIAFVVLITIHIVLNLVFQKPEFLWIQNPWRF